MMIVTNLLHTLAAGGLDISGLPQQGATSAKLQTILNIVFMVAGGIAVLIVVLAGLRYVLSQGNPQETSVAKNAILYALIGLVVIISATAIVNFVIFRVA